MSRCFPYPPPGYTLGSARNEALIESIKLQKEKERKKEKKEKRKEKRKEKKERREKRKDEPNPNPNLEYNVPGCHAINKSEIPKNHISDKSEIPKNHISDKSDIPKHHFTQDGQKLEVVHKKREVENEQSSLTEEHACPVSLSVPSSSFESTEKSKKRRRNSLPTDDTHVHGKVILIRLPSKKQNELDALAKEQQQPCLVSKAPDMPDCVQDGPAMLLNATINTSAAQTTQQICSTSRQIEAGEAGINNKPTLTKKAVLTPMQKMESEYKNLLDGCFPPLVKDDPSDDLDWLLVGRMNQAEKKLRFGSEGLSCSRSSGLWPRAEYLPEVDVCALPYTVPY